MTASFIPETGLGVANANALIDLSFANDHHAARGAAQLAEWQGTLITSSITAAVNDVVTHEGHPFATGDGPLMFANLGGALPAGLDDGGEYWAIRVDADSYKVATSYANALAGTAVDITDVGTGTHTVSYPDVAKQKAAIVRATDYIQQVWVPRLKGIKATDEQGLFYPAKWVYDARGTLITGVPAQVKKACAEYALRGLSAPLQSDDDGITSESKSAAPFSYTRTYGSKSMNPFPIADAWLSELSMPTPAWRA